MTLQPQPVAVGEAGERTGVLILSAWVEGEGSGLRIRIIGTRDVTDGEGSDIKVAASTVDQVCDVVREWLGEIEKKSSR